MENYNWCRLKSKALFLAGQEHCNNIPNFFATSMYRYFNILCMKSLCMHGQKAPTRTASNMLEDVSLLQIFIITSIILTEITRRVTLKHLLFICIPMILRAKLYLHAVLMDHSTKICLRCVSQRESAP